jgi:hypothetical protein
MGWANLTAPASQARRRLSVADKNVRFVRSLLVPMIETNGGYRHPLRKFVWALSNSRP